MTNRILQIKPIIAKTLVFGLMVFTMFLVLGISCGKSTITPTSTVLVTLSSTSTSLTNTSSIPITATFSEAVTGFAVGDLTVGNGTANSFVAVSTTVYTFNVTPTAQGAVTVDIAAGVAKDAAGNNNSAAEQFSITYDSTAPTVTVSSTSTSPTKTSPIPMTATFSEAVTGFAVGDITVGNGTAGSFVAVSATVYTYNVTLTASGAVTVNIAAGVAQDAAGNNNSAATQFSITYDNSADSTAPTVTVSSTSTSPTKTSPIPVTATFSKAVTGFAVEDITVGNGTAGSFVAVSATVYSFNVTPTTNGAVTVNIAAGVAQDAALNNNTGATQLIITYDNTAPTITLSSTRTSPTNTSPIPMTATFSEAVTGFAIGDLTVGNGTAVSFVAVSTTVYTFNVTPTTIGVVTVNIAASVAQDAAGNNNTAAAQFSITYNGTAPAVTISGSSFGPGTIIVPVGTEVTWTNNDSTAHTVTSDTGLFDSGNLPSGATFKFTFGQTGTFDYHCNIHTFMTGTVIVQ